MVMEKGIHVNNNCGHQNKQYKYYCTKTDYEVFRIIVFQNQYLIPLEIHIEEGTYSAEAEHSPNKKYSVKYRNHPLSYA